jgi:hypothetical protein
MAIHRFPRNGRLSLIEVECRYVFERARLWKVVEVARQNHASSLGQLHVQHLMAGRMPGCQLDDDGPIVEHIVFISVDETVLLVRSAA